MSVSIIDNVLHLVLSAPWDPDDIVDFRVVLIPASADPDHVTIGMPGDGW